MSFTVMILLSLALMLPYNVIGSKVKSLKLTQHWPKTFCMSKDVESKKCTIPKYVDYWTIHGLWPQVNWTCTGTDFKWTSIQGLKGELDQFWTDLQPSSGHFFWKHEWDDHGKCATPIPKLADQWLFFKTTLTLRQSLADLYGSLKACDIHPDRKQTYKRTSIFNCLKKALGVDVEITCFRPKNTAYLLEIRVCLDEGLKVRDCHDRPRHNCPADGIRYPPK